MRPAAHGDGATQIRFAAEDRRWTRGRSRLSKDVIHVAENMAELQVRRLPVMNRDKGLVGIVSLADLAIEGSLPKTAKALHGISQPGGQHNHMVSRERASR
jgi:CBS-domain-containing membrane protein